jgi:AraC-like DNA-binding protein
LDELISRVNLKTEPRVERSLAYIASHSSRCDLTLEEVARQVNVSKWHLERLLKWHTGLTFRAAVRRERLNNARLLLESSMLTIKEIAHKVGFRYPSELDRDFKKVFGMSPRDWRRGMFSSGENR